MLLGEVHDGLFQRGCGQVPAGEVLVARRVQKHKRVAKPLMVELSMIMVDELGDGPARGS